MTNFKIIIIVVFLYPVTNLSSQILSKFESNISYFKEMKGIKLFSNTFKVGLDYKISETNQVGLEIGLVLGLNDFLLQQRYLLNTRMINKVYPLFINYSLTKNRNHYSFGLGTELIGYGSNNILSESSYWWLEIKNLGHAGQLEYFKIRDRMQLIVPFTYGYQFYKNLSATAGITFYRTKCFEPDSYFDVTYFHHLTYSVGLKYRFKRKGNE
jgi:hypothetical protein